MTRSRTLATAALVVALLIAVLGAASLVAGCGGSDDTGDAGEASPASTGASEDADAGGSGAEDDSGLVVVSNEEYGFTFKYDPDVLTEQDGLSSESAGAQSVYRAGFFDESGTQSSGQYRDGFLFNVYRLNGVLDESMMPAFKKDLEDTILPRLVDSMGPSTLVGELQSVEDDNLIGYYTDVVYDIDGTPFNARLYFLINGDVEYQITFQAAQERWAQMETAFRQVIDTFEATPVEPASGS